MASGPAEDAVAALRAAADPSRAAPMARYMRGRHPFLGVAAPRRRELTAPLLRAARAWHSAVTVGVIDDLWRLPEREFRYVGCDVARAAARRWDPERLADLRRWITTDSWWDTVDPLAVATGDLVEAHPTLVGDMDRWIGDDDIWVARVALLHQVGRKDRSDAERLFSYCELRQDDTEFFIRKAIGWALRDLARTRPDEVRRFVAAHPGLSSLSRREALKHLGG